MKLQKKMQINKPALLAFSVNKNLVINTGNLVSVLPNGRLQSYSEYLICDGDKVAYKLNVIHYSKVILIVFSQIR